jgi:hypothetical protein
MRWLLATRYSNTEAEALELGNDLVQNGVDNDFLFIYFCNPHSPFTGPAGYIILISHSTNIGFRNDETVMQLEADHNRRASIGVDEFDGDPMSPHRLSVILCIHLKASFAS